MRNLITFLTCVLLSTSGFATLFQPISVKKHLHESSGVVEGEVQRIESELDENEKIITRVTLKARKWIGQFEASEGEVSVVYPGGQIGNQVRKISGAPHFSLGENVVVFVRSDSEKNWVSNLGLGKYSIKRIGNEKIIVNQVFPTEPNMGQMSLKNFYNIAQEAKEEKFTYRYKEKYEFIQEKEMQESSPKGRSIASVKPLEENQSNVNPFWLVLLLGSLGVLVGVFRKRNS